MDCGPACLRMIAGYFGKAFSLDYLKDITSFSRTGVRMQSLVDAATQLKMDSMVVGMTAEELLQKSPGPCILHWNNNHFVVLPPQEWQGTRQAIKIADPQTGMRKISLTEFKSKWETRADGKGLALLLQPAADFEEQAEHPTPKGFLFLSGYLKQHRSSLIKVILTLVVTSMCTLMFPLLTQALVDKGITVKQKNIVVLVLCAQLALFAGNISMELIRSRIILKLNTRVTIHIVSDFLLKLIRLPIRFFDARRVGDIQQRILDHQRIELFLSGTTLATLFSFISFIVFSCILASYNWLLLLVFFVMSCLSVGWIFLFLNKRKTIESAQFSLNSKNQNVLNELVVGMPEIKLNRAEQLQQNNWKTIQEELYERNIQSLQLSQYQQVGSGFFSQLKNILITFMSAIYVINEEMTLGMMLAVSFIIGQMNAPLDQLLGLVQTAQDAKLSLERLAEVHTKQEEVTSLDAATPEESRLPDGDIYVRDVSFRYDRDWVLQHVDLHIPRGKITALVGASGSGKTTLLKLLLQFYEPQKGSILIGNKNIDTVPLATWRSHTGVVMQDGYIFSDSVLQNITMSQPPVDQQRLERALQLSNIKRFVDQLPVKAHTQIGNNGIGLSMGQKQRILIARAIYSNPEILFFDEATSSLDARNEREIMDQLQGFYEGKTVVVIAHRLSTIKHADQIVVFDEGRILESGTHQELIASRGTYFQLVKNQLDLDNT